MLSSLLDHSAAGALLKQGCARLGLPDAVAVELIRFLISKRVHDLLPPEARPRQMCPGVQLERLWNWMLLRTKVSTAVHELVGGVVDHVPTEEQHLSETAVMLQKLYSMNLIAYEGWEPHMEFWEPGTIMSGIYVREPTETSKAPELYVTPAVTEQQYQQLLEDMRVLYQGHSRKNGWEGPSTFQQAPAAHDLRAGSAGAASAHATAGIAAAAQSAAHQHQYTWPVSVWAEGRGDMQAMMFSVTAHDSMTVRLLKRELLQQGVGRSSNGGSSSEVRQTSPSQLRIFQCLTELQDHMLVPDSPGAILRVVLPGQEPPSKKPTYTVKVKMLGGFQCDITECGPWSLVWEFRSAVASRIDTTPENIRLIFAGKQLEDGRRLDEYKQLQDGSAINCVLRSVTQ